MEKRFKGKVAIVTASTQGIGFAIAERLGLEGASVVISSRKQQNVDEAAEKLRAKGIEVLALVCHVSNDQQRKDLIQKTAQKYGKIDVIVSNAAANPSVDPILQTKDSVLDKLWEINVKASILLLKDAAPHLHKGSSVVIVSSIAGFNPPASMSMYGVTKTALFGLTKALAAEMAPNTRVNCIAPGFVPTNFASFITSNQAIRQELEAKTLLGRLGTTEDMAAGTAFLASDDASYITGETLVIAGGMPSRLFSNANRMLRFFCLFLPFASMLVDLVRDYYWIEFEIGEMGNGFGIAERLGMEGASEVISSRNQTADKLRTKGIEVLALKSGKIDVIVSNAAANPSVDPILQTEDSVFDKLWEINVKASILLLKDAAPHLHRGSSVVIVSSIASLNLPASSSMYICME
ncbi:hypothetical protein HN51_063459 [Arachis hypogaea]